VILIEYGIAKPTAFPTRKSSGGQVNLLGTTPQGNRLENMGLLHVS
jgi:hypothetical protein